MRWKKWQKTKRVWKRVWTFRKKLLSFDTRQRNEGGAVSRIGDRLRRRHLFFDRLPCLLCRLVRASRRPAAHLRVHTPEHDPLPQHRLHQDEAAKLAGTRLYAGTNPIKHFCPLLTVLYLKVLTVLYLKVLAVLYLKCCKIWLAYWVCKVASSATFGGKMFYSLCCRKHRSRPRPGFPSSTSSVMRTVSSSSARSLHPSAWRGQSIRAGPCARKSRPDVRARWRRTGSPGQRCSTATSFPWTTTCASRPSRTRSRTVRISMLS